MASHRSAWDGMTIVVFDCDAQIAMQIEQSIAITAPWLETKIESFEAYDDALLHCRDRRDVGFFILGDHCGQHAAEEVFRNLASPYESALGWPAGAVLTHNGTPTIEGFKALSTDGRFVDYIDKKLLLDLQAIPVIIDKLWEMHTSKVESSLFPESLQKFICALAEQSGLDQAAQSFIHRTQNKLSSELNISWYDAIALRWAHSFASIQACFPKVLDANKSVSRLVSSVSNHLVNAKINGSIANSIGETCSNKIIPIGGRVAICAWLLDESRRRSELTECLSAIKSKSVPGSPAILRTISKSIQAIEKFASELEEGSETSTSSLERVG